MKPNFTKEFLQSLNDWQAGAISKKDKNGLYDDNIKINFAKNLIEYSKNIPEKFKSFKGICYRKFNSGNNMELGLEKFINEIYSSWTTDYKALKNNTTLKKPTKTQIGIIFKKDIENCCNVILNLNTLYSDEEFLETIEKYKSEIENFDLGIGKYKNSQNEIILKNTNLYIDNVCAYFGQGNNIMDFIKKYFPSVLEDERQKQKLLAEIRKIAPEIGKKKWVEGESAKNIIEKHKFLANLLSNK